MIYVDANAIIRLLEGDAATRAPLEARLRPLRGTAGFLATSRLTRIECRCKPLREGNTVLLDLYEAFFNSVEVVLLDVTPDVIEMATDLRARLNVKTPDAIHLASAILSGATPFLTGDRQLARCNELTVEIL